MRQPIKNPDPKCLFKKSGGPTRPLILKAGQTLAAAAAEAGIPVRTDCGGAGICGQCRIQILPCEGLSPSTAAEALFLDPLQMKAGDRLACQAVSDRSQTIAVRWPGHGLADPERKIASLAGSYRGKALGVAVDLGTTRVDLLLCDLDTGASLISASERNAQKCYGDDVISRIAAAKAPGTGLMQMQKLAVQTINRLLSACLETGKIKRSAIVQAAIAGNTAMTLILAGIDPKSLGRYPYRPEITEFPLYTAEALGLCMAPETPVYLFPAVSGFIGGDTISALVAHGAFDRDQTCLLVDIGTNGELALCQGNHLLAASCATGPAFEGARISCGMSAMNGAVDQMDFDPALDGFVWHVIGGEKGIKPIGLCGSGLIDALEGLLRAGILSPDGLLDQNSPLVDKTDQGVRVELISAGSAGHGKALTLTQKDIGELQLAKAAICAGIELLLLRSGTNHIDNLILTGAFGSGFDYGKAAAVGMLPKSAVAGKVTIRPGLVVKGAVMALVNPEARKQALTLSRQIVLLELGGDPGFEDRFLEAMAFPTNRNAK